MTYLRNCLNESPYEDSIKLLKTPRLIANIKFSPGFSKFSSENPCNASFKVSIAVLEGALLSVASLYTT